MKKSELKKLIKECLVEILSEGLGNFSQDVTTQLVSPVQESFSRNQKRQTTNPPRQHPTDMVSYNQHPRPAPNNSAVNEVIRNVSGGDATLSSIFADTLQTTMAYQMSADRNNISAIADPHARAAAEHSPEEMFGDAANGKWAHLAFVGTSEKNQ
jgi:hypothetical protein